MKIWSQYIKCINEKSLLNIDCEFDYFLSFEFPDRRVKSIQKKSKENIDIYVLIYITCFCNEKDLKYI